MSDSDEANGKQLKQLLSKRSSVKERSTKFRKYLDIVCSSPNLSNLQIKELKIKIEKVRVMSNKFDDLQSQIEVENSQNIDTEIELRDEIKQTFASHLAVAQELLGKYCNDSTNSDLHNTSSQCHHDRSSQCHHVEFKLPQIQIAKFDGAYFRWLEFRDTYVSLIHNNEHIKSVHKFHYLVSYLEGEAARIIFNLEISDKNYADAWQLLLDRYDNKRQLVNHHLNSLVNITTFTRESDKSLRFLVDHATKNLRALSSLSQPTDQWDTLIIHIFSSKFDSRTVMKWEEYHNSLSDVPTLKEFSKFLTDRADVLQTLNHNKFDKPKVTQPQTHTQSRNNGNASRTTKSFTSSGQNTGSVTNRCVICKGDHWIYDCPKFIAKSVQV